MTPLTDAFFRQVEERRCDLFIEAGAKEASASTRALTLSCVRRVVAFEANPLTHARYAERLDARIEYRNEALWSTYGKANVFVRVNDAGEPQANGRASLMLRPDARCTVLPVAAVSLDGFLDEREYQFEAAALWIDVEGACGPVLEGAAETLVYTQVALVEVEDRVYWTRQWLAPKVQDFLAMYGLTPIAADAQSRYQRNVLFVRTQQPSPFVLPRTA